MEQGLEVKFTGWFMSLLAAMAMVIVPVTPSAAADGAARQGIVRAAENENVGILSQSQVDALARSNPKLHAKLMDAYKANTAPQLTPAEKKLVTGMTKKNLAEYKAGSPAAAPIFLSSGAWLAGAGWLVFAFIGLVALVILWNLLTTGVARPAAVR